MSETSKPDAASTTLTPDKNAPAALVAEAHDFRQSSLLSPRQLRNLRTHETQFMHAMEARVALLLRTEFPLKLASLQIIPFHKLTEGWSAPTHLTLFKAEPLRGVSVLEIPLHLGLTMVDRLMGGPGRVEPVARELSEIEKALLDQIVQIILEEWSSNWTPIKALKTSVLASESSGRFLQSAPPQTNMLTIAITAKLVDCTGQILLAFPYAMMEPCLRDIGGGSEPVVIAPTPAPTPAPKWNRCLDDITLPVTAEWQGLELSARDVLHLKVGDVLQVSPQLARQISLRLGELSRFNGRLGTVDGHWAIELTQAAKP